LDHRGWSKAVERNAVLDRKISLAVAYLLNVATDLQALAEDSIVEIAPLQSPESAP
jgi:hypothetical protein